MPVFMPWPPAGRWMCAASPASSTRPRRYVVTWRVASPKQLTHTGSACAIDSPVSRSQAAATSANSGGDVRLRGGVPRSHTTILVTPPGRGPTITMPPDSVCPVIRGASSTPLTSARNISMVAAVPGKSKPAAPRTVLRPPSHPTSHGAVSVAGPSGPRRSTSTPAPPSRTASTSSPRRMSAPSSTAHSSRRLSVSDCGTDLAAWPAPSRSEKSIGRPPK